ncbi:hypothetical protein ACEWY4_018935 [Coilia grayii]|uniref:Uncharacterized protein n=1 Tax=Coilia grayii TaxID=363190 RepID=A0ABD1JG76_9TELE
MGNTLSCCCPPNPCERQDEEQRLINEGVQSPQTSIKVSEGGPVNPDCVTTGSSESPSPTNDQSKTSLLLEGSQPEVVSCEAVLQKEADTLALQEKPEASAVVSDVAENTASAQVESTFLDHEKVATGVVSEVLAGATKIVASQSFVKLTGESDVTSSTPQTQDAATGEVTAQGVFFKVMESKLEPADETASQAASNVTDSQTVSTGIEKQATPTMTGSQAESTEKPDSQATSTPAESRAASTGIKNQAAATMIKSQTVSIEKLEIQAGSTTNMSKAVSIEQLGSQTNSNIAESQAAAAEKLASQAVSAEKLSLDLPHAALDKGCDLAKPETEVKVAEVCPAKVEGQNVSAVTNEATPLVTSPRKEALAEVQQDAVVHLNGSLAEESAKCLPAGLEPALPGDHLTKEASSKIASATEDLTITSLEPVSKEEDRVQSNDIGIHGDISIKQVGGDASLPQENLSTVSPGVKQRDTPVENSSAMQVVNETPKGLSPLSGGDVQVGSVEHQPLLDASAALDHDQDAQQPHFSDVGHEVGVEQPYRKTDLDLSSATSEKSPSAKDANESDLIEECCNGKELKSSRSSSLVSVKTENAAPNETGDSPAESSPQDGLFGTDTVSSLGHLMEGQETVKLQMSQQDKLDIELKSAATVTGINDAGPAESPQDEKAGWLSPVLDGTETWLTCGDDLYRGEEEIEEELEKQHLISKPNAELEDRCSLEPPMAILMYSEREWKGQTAKSAVIRKGYAALSQNFGSLQRVRGDNYCALRATLYQALMNATQPPDWLQQESFLLIPEELESRYGLIKGWVFPDLCKQISGIENAVDLMKHYLGLLQKWWHAAAASPGLEGRRSVCEQLFQGSEEEFGLMEAVKLLMLARAVELHTAMQREDEVPIFCWLLFARDTSSCPRTFLANHLSQVGFTGGMEQVEMFLLGYALHHTIKAFRLYMADTEEFITHYPDDHIQDWPCICLVTEDDRHYNVAVGEPSQPQEDLHGGAQ